MLTVRAALITAGPAVAALTRALPLAQFRDHPLRVVIEPFDGADAVERKGRQNGTTLFVERARHRPVEITAQTRHQSQSPCSCESRHQPVARYLHV